MQISLQLRKINEKHNYSIILNHKKCKNGLVDVAFYISQIQALKICSYYYLLATNNATALLRFQFRVGIRYVVILVYIVYNRCGYLRYTSLKSKSIMGKQFNILLSFNMLLSRRAYEQLIQLILLTRLVNHRTCNRNRKVVLVCVCIALVV